MLVWIWKILTNKSDTLQYRLSAVPMLSTVHLITVDDEGGGA